MGYYCGPKNTIKMGGKLKNIRDPVSCQVKIDRKKHATPVSLLICVSLHHFHQIKCLLSYNLSEFQLSCFDREAIEISGHADFLLFRLNKVSLAQASISPRMVFGTN